jgi:hypothetical protein
LVGVCSAFPALAATFAALALALAVSADAAGAVAPAPGWSIHSFATPTNFSTSDNAHCLATVSEQQPVCDSYQVTATDAGSLPMNGSTAVLTDTLPGGLTVQRIAFVVSGSEGDLSSSDCNTVAVQCQFSGALAPDERLQMIVYVTVNEPSTTTSLTNAATVSGGGAPQASTEATNQVSSAPPSFGAESFSFDVTGQDGLTDTQAAGHPYELTATLALNSEPRFGPEGNFTITSVQDVKDVLIDLPLGFLASALATPECKFSQLSGGNCPPGAVVGHILTEPSGSASLNGPVYNMVPEHGYPAEFGYTDAIHGTHALYASVVPSAAGYLLRLTAPDLPQVTLTNLLVTVFGDPAAKDGDGNTPLALLTNPSDCSGRPLLMRVHMDSWQNPGGYNADGTPDFNHPGWVSVTSQSPPVTGCSLLQFTPELYAQPTTNVADSPSGLELELKSPQSEAAEVNATPALQRAVVTLPEGMTVDPSAGDGLQACSIAQIGWLGGVGGGSSQFFDAAPPTCPEQSKVGSLELTTPMFAGVLTGALYLAAQDENPFGSMLAAYAVVNDPVTGVLLKIAAELKADPRTGRLTVVLAETPQLAFSDLKLRFFDGPRALLATPESCATFTTTSDLTPWSAPDSGPDARPFDSFAITSGCISGFAPTFTAGSTNLQAGAFTPFIVSLSRQDTDQELAALTVRAPPGVLATIANVPLCPEPQAQRGECPQASQVGHATVGLGPGPYPAYVPETGGPPAPIYLTGPYNGAPFGLSIVVPAVVGPFTLGTVVVRASIAIDPVTAALTISSGGLPTILQGIPLRIRRIDLALDREGFIFNPTNCNPLAVNGAISSTQGASAAVANHFQIANCRTLKFSPKLTALTYGNGEFSGHGASLHVKITTGQGQANMRSLKLDLPQRLPARLETIQRACPEAVFKRNPDACPKTSKIGSATVATPVLGEAMRGPAILVSHGGKAFPDLVLVLQAQGVRIDLTGALFVNEKNITSVTFRTIPDVPIRRLDLMLPEGRSSVLAASSSLCTGPLHMSTAITGQNGARLKPTVKVAVAGCKHRKKHHSTHRKATKKRRSTHR